LKDPPFGGSFFIYGGHFKGWCHHFSGGTTKVVAPTFTCFLPQPGATALEAAPLKTWHYAPGPVNLLILSQMDGT